MEKRRQFVDIRIILILHGGNKILKQVPNFYFKLNNIVLGIGSNMKISFLGTVGITALRALNLFKKNYGLLYNF